MKQETEHVRKLEVPLFAGHSALLHDPAKNPEISAPKFAYKIHADGSAPIMSNLHVAFATKSVELLRERKTLTGKQLIEMWNRELQDVSSVLLPAPVMERPERHGDFFNNCFFVMPQLHPMPVALLSSNTA